MKSSLFLRLSIASLAWCALVLAIGIAIAVAFTAPTFFGMTIITSTMMESFIVSAEILGMTALVASTLGTIRHSKKEPA